jgi:sugar phosphate isomerase/epimerase
MNVKFYAPQWGNILPFDTFCENVKAAGYDGVELALPFDEKGKGDILETVEKHGLEIIGQYWQSLEKDLELHAENYEKYLRNLISANPVLINCQTGKDYYTFDQNKRLFDLAAKLSEESGIEIIHETHRNKSLYAAHVTQDYLTKLPDLRICLDISHWCNVHESLLEDQQDAVDLAISRAHHIHSRVGFQEGPQINDPRAPEWTEILETHLNWWDQVAESHRKADRTMTITTEFGPALYMPVMPYTQTPLANQWDVNVFMLDLLTRRYRS